jgi:phospholipid/cholesterol/gamma-HCH transport system substrate-binding protein|tara:strand:- start:1232 stop:1468 length:237 start_codon:yes stop_codon:yes gene_type:complete
LSRKISEGCLTNAWASKNITRSVSILNSGLLGEQYVGFQPGFAIDGIDNLVEGDFIEDTKTALVLEDLIGQFLFSKGS